MGTSTTCVGATTGGALAPRYAAAERLPAHPTLPPTRKSATSKTNGLLDGLQRAGDGARPEERIIATENFRVDDRTQSPAPVSLHHEAP